MPYYFECDYCNTRTDFEPFDHAVDLSCDRCGEDLCKVCVVKFEGENFCDDCYEDARDDAEESEDEWGV